VCFKVLFVTEQMVLPPVLPADRYGMRSQFRWTPLQLLWSGCGAEGWGARRGGWKLE
jgi:hypothetical protein